MHRVRSPSRPALRVALDDSPLLERGLAHASDCLPPDPLSDYGRGRLVEEARQQAALGLDPKLLDVLPRVGPDFDYTGDV